MYYEIYKENKAVITGTEIFNDLAITNSLMDEPSCSLSIPAKYISYITDGTDIKIYFDDDTVFWGVVTEKQLVGNVLNVELTHIIHEWHDRQISVNNAVKDKSLEFVYVENAENLIYDSVNEETIASNTLKCTQAEWDKGFTQEELIEKTKTRAWSVDSGFLPVTAEIIQETVDGKITNKVKFSTQAGTYVVVNVSISDNIEEETEVEPRVVDELNDIMYNINFVASGWNISFNGNVESRTVDYVYSRMDKLEALTKTCELTPDVYWRTNLNNEKVVEVGTFGELKDIVFSTLPAGKQNIQILDTPQVDEDYTESANVLSVYGDKSDSGASSLTLREVYNDPKLQNSDFPVYITKTALTNNVNNERNYIEYYEQFPALASNNDKVYSIIDKEGIALRGGKIKEGTLGFNDVAPFNVDHGEGRTLVITDTDRINASLTVYNGGIKWLKDHRPSIRITFTCSKVPYHLLAGDRVHFRYGYDLFCDLEISNYWRKLLKDDKWYIEEITRNYSGGQITAEVTLSKFLQIKRSVDRE